MVSAWEPRSSADLPRKERGYSVGSIIGGRQRLVGTRIRGTRVREHPATGLSGRGQAERRVDRGQLVEAEATDAFATSARVDSACLFGEHPRPVAVVLDSGSVGKTRVERKSRWGRPARWTGRRSRLTGPRPRSGFPAARVHWLLAVREADSRHHAAAAPGVRSSTTSASPECPRGRHDGPPPRMGRPRAPLRAQRPAGRRGSEIAEAIGCVPSQDAVWGRMPGSEVGRAWKSAWSSVGRRPATESAW